MIWSTPELLAGDHDRSRADEISEELRDAMVFTDGIVRKQIDAQRRGRTRQQGQNGLTPNLPP